MDHKQYGGAAFPSGDGGFGGGPNHDTGMTLLDYFAGIALPFAREQAGKAGQRDIDELFPGSAPVTREQIAARLAYKMAGAMLVERPSR